MQVFVAGRAFRHFAQCECGWSGNTRFTRGAAVVDVGQHAALSGHYPVTVPVVTHDAPVLELQAS